MQDVIETFNSNPESLSGKHSGSGMFSDVALSPCGKYAIKHGNHGFADGWLLFAAALLRLHKDERPDWAPCIHSLRVDLDNGTFVALMDALVDEEDSYVDGGHVIDLYNAQECGESGDGCECDGCTFVWECQHNPDHASCVEFLYEIEVETGVPLYYDISGNTMWDEVNERSVLNDPVCVVGWKYAKNDLRYKEQIREFVRECSTKSPDIFIKGET